MGRLGRESEKRRRRKRRWKRSVFFFDRRRRRREEQQQQEPPPAAALRGLPSGPVPARPHPQPEQRGGGPRDGVRRLARSRQRGLAAHRGPRRPLRPVGGQVPLPLRVKGPGRSRGASLPGPRGGGRAPRDVPRGQGGGKTRAERLGRERKVARLARFLGGRRGAAARGRRDQRAGQAAQRRRRGVGPAKVPDVCDPGLRAGQAEDPEGIRTRQDSVLRKRQVGDSTRGGRLQDGQSLRDSPSFTAGRVSVPGAPRVPFDVEGVPEPEARLCVYDEERGKIHFLFFLFFDFFDIFEQKTKKKCSLSHALSLS